MKKKNEIRRSADKGDGTMTNPMRSNDYQLQLLFAKEIQYMQLDGTPGLTYRKGKTRHSYQRSPVMPADSPIAMRTRVKLQKSVP